jgi:tetratricopeptide (TPR) repeat protein
MIAYDNKKELSVKKLFCVLVLGVVELFACVNSTYSRLDEKRITNDLAFIVMGQFAHRSPDFYRYQVNRALAILKEKPEDFIARNDLAVAYIKLGSYRNAEEELKKNEQAYPGKYETAANLGVLYKKKQDFAKAAAYIEQSLTIKAGGHMGLGDYYLKMCESLASGDVSLNFLGVAYDAEPEENASVANKDYLISLIKNDYMFADSYLILGDILYVEGDYQLAALAYGRAQYLGVGFNIYERLNLLIKKWKAKKLVGEVVLDRVSLYRTLKVIMTKAEKWVEDFKHYDALIIKESGEAKEFNGVIAKMEAEGIPREYPLTVGIYKAYQLDPTAIFFGVWFIILAIITLLIIRRAMIKKKNKIERAN